LDLLFQGERGERSGDLRVAGESSHDTVSPSLVAVRANRASATWAGSTSRFTSLR
jgi:hypothetical protein